MSTVLANLNQTLFNAIAKASSVPEEDTYNPRDNVASAEHTLLNERNFFQAIESSIADKISKNLSVDPEEYRILRVYAEKLRKSESDVISAKKRAAETAVLLSSKFDAAQVLSLVKQLPNGLSKDLDVIVGDLLQIIVDHIEHMFAMALNGNDLSRLVSNETDYNKKLELLLDSVLSHEYLNKMRQMKVVQLNNTIITRLEQTIAKMTVPKHRASDGLLELDKDKRVTVSEMEDMISSIVVQ